MDHLSAARAGPWPVESSDADRLGSSGDVFQTLVDPSRRPLVHSLFAADGQTLGDLSARLPGMTRFGVMKHLRLLEAAGLVTSRKICREKLHYLNPVPIRLTHARWTSKYTEP